MIRALAEKALRDAQQVLVLADSVVFETWISLLGVVADKVEIPLWPGPGQPLLRIQTHPRDEEPPDIQPDDPILRIAAQEPLLLTFRQSRTELI